MRYINPKTDFGFKKIFASVESKDILISFLNAIIYENEELIDDLEIIDPYQAPQIKGRKYSYLDVKAKLKDGTKVVIEMQVLNAESFEKRILYNTAKAYSIQLAKGEDYLEINPVIAVTITDFTMFKEFDDYRSCFRLKEITHLTDYLTQDFQLIFVELTKFKKKLEELETLAEKWIYFLKSASKIDDVPENFKSIISIDHAFEIAERSNLSELELDEILKEEMWIQEQKSMITFAEKEAEKKGLQKGLEKGRQEGLEEGIEKGQVQLIIKLINHKMGEIPPEITKQIEQLSTDKIDQLTIDLLSMENFDQLQSWLS